MTTTPGPISLTVVTLYCRTTEQQCEHFHSHVHGFTGECWKTIDRLLIPTNGILVLTPDWCPLRK